MLLRRERSAGTGPGVKRARILSSRGTAAELRLPAVALCPGFYASQVHVGTDVEFGTVRAAPAAVSGILVGENRTEVFPRGRNDEHAARTGREYVSARVDFHAVATAFEPWLFDRLGIEEN